ncbi:MAG: hypothetical protein LLG05_15240 [Porphyromonadaceae bacterium]|nr:hypothetical protein [Porphyromonadaceae bacterium]
MKSKEPHLSSEDEKMLRIASLVVHRTLKLIKEYPDAEITLTIKPKRKRLWERKWL